MRKESSDGGAFTDDITSRDYDLASDLPESVRCLIKRCQLRLPWTPIRVILSGCQVSAQVDSICVLLVDVVLQQVRGKRPWS